MKMLNCNRFSTKGDAMRAFEIETKKDYSICAEGTIQDWWAFVTWLFAEYKPEGERQMTNENNVYCKYRILDAKTGEEKHGKYFVLKIDAKDEKERKCVEKAMEIYAVMHANCGNTEYANAVLDYLYGKTDGGAA